jgi:hypothetical protein
MPHTGAFQLETADGDFGNGVEYRGETYQLEGAFHFDSPVFLSTP